MQINDSGLSFLDLRRSSNYFTQVFRLELPLSAETVIAGIQVDFRVPGNSGHSDISCLRNRHRCEFIQVRKVWTQKTGICSMYVA